MDHKEASLRLREAQEERSNLLSLTHTPGWRWYTGLLDQQIANRRNQFELVPLEKMDQILGEQFLKGELAGFRVARIIVEARIEELESEIEELEAQVL